LGGGDRKIEGEGFGERAREIGKRRGDGGRVRGGEREEGGLGEKKGWEDRGEREGGGGGGEG